MMHAPQSLVFVMSNRCVLQRVRRCNRAVWAAPVAGPVQHVADTEWCPANLLGTGGGGVGVGRRYPRMGWGLPAAGLAAGQVLEMCGTLEDVIGA